MAGHEFLSQKAAQRIQKDAEVRATKKRKKHRKTEVKPVDIGAMTTLRMKLRGTRELGYEYLERSETLQTYARRFRYDDPKQRACMSQEFTVELPELLARAVERELSPVWTKGKGDPKAN